jgi:DNA-binding IclR family transcriptional regulator
MSTTILSLREKPGISPANRSLERGVEILRAFRPGSESLGNAELADRTGLSRSTVTRLTQTLVGVGMLQVDARQRTYRLAPAVLSLAHAMRAGSTVLRIAVPRMRALAEGMSINVGLATSDRDEMVVLESIRYSPRADFRSIVSGHRVPIELTSLGRAYLAVLPAERREALLAIFKERRGAQWPALAKEIELAIQHVEQRGYCYAEWQPELVSVSTPLVIAGSIHVLNVSATTDAPLDTVASELHAPLLKLREEITLEIEKSEDMPRAVG